MLTRFLALKTVVAISSLAHGCPDTDIKEIHPQDFKKPFELEFPHLVHWRVDCTFCGNK